MKLLISVSGKATRTVGDIEDLDPKEEQVLLRSVNLFGDSEFNDVKLIPVGLAAKCLQAVIKASPDHRNASFARSLLRRLK